MKKLGMIAGKSPLSAVAILLKIMPPITVLFPQPLRAASGQMRNGVGITHNQREEVVWSLPMTKLGCPQKVEFEMLFSAALVPHACNSALHRMRQENHNLEHSKDYIGRHIFMHF